MNASLDTGNLSEAYNARFTKATVCILPAFTAIFLRKPISIQFSAF